MRFARLVVGLLVICIGMPLPVQAGMLGTEKALAPERAVRINQLLEREAVRAQLERHGVAPEQVASRLAALSDEEAALLAGHMEELAAGGSVVGALVTVFLVLLITDILGLTKVFPFTRAACDRGRC